MNPANRTSHRSRWYWAGAAIAIVGLVTATVVMVWDWNWFRPLLEARLSAALGRAVSMERLEVHPGRVTNLTAYGVTLANPPGFEGPDLATIPRTNLSFEIDTWWRSSRIVLPAIELDEQCCADSHRRKQSVVLQRTFSHRNRRYRYSERNRSHP